MTKELTADYSSFLMVQIIPFSEQYVTRVKQFTDKWIGADYYSEEELLQTVKASRVGDLCSSFLLVEGEKILGIRLTYPPGRWLELPSPDAITPHKWKVDFNSAAYFKSLFVDESFQAKGYGRLLSEQALLVLRKMGAKAVVCHSWKESPGDSSRKYLQKMGFEEVAEHPLFWHDIQYLCSGCQQPKCICTATEMIKYIG